MTSTSATSPSLAVPQFRCEQSGCTKSFRRKEHLNRHAKSHDSERRHRCHVCGSTFARSDVLRRHIQHHPREDRPRRISVACIRCREHKLKCDDNTPCSQCDRSSSSCFREAGDSSTSLADAQSLATQPDTGSQTVSDLTDAYQSPDQGSGVDAFASEMQADAAPQTQSETHLLSSLGDISPEMTHLVAVYFTDVHDVWPILHQATFEQSPCTRALLMAVGTLGSYFESSHHHAKLAPVLQSAVLAALIQPEIYLQDLQAGLLCLVYYLHFASDKRMLERAIHVNAALIATYRSRGLFRGLFQGQHDSNDPFREWVHNEEIKRLAFFSMRADVYLSILSDQPPNIRYSELEFSLPKTESFWSASNYEEQQRLEWNEPAAREKILYANLAYDASNNKGNLSQTYRLSEEDYHTLLCTLQSSVWDVAHLPSLSKCPKIAAETWSTPQLAICISHLDQWVQNVEKQCQANQRYFAGTSEASTSMITSISLYMWHLMAIRLHYPLNDPQDSDALSIISPSNAATNENGKRRRLDSPSSRIALWHAVQITRVYIHETLLKRASMIAARTRLNVFHQTIIGRAAILVCNYTKHIQNCSACMGRDFGESVNLITAECDHDILQRWKNGEAIHTYMNVGSVEFPLCSCSLDDISTWYLQLLSVTGYESETLTAFFQVLRR